LQQRKRLFYQAPSIAALEARAASFRQIEHPVPHPCRRTSGEGSAKTDPADNWRGERVFVDACPFPGLDESETLILRNNCVSVLPCRAVARVRYFGGTGCCFPRLLITSSQAPIFRSRTTRVHRARRVRVICALCLNASVRMGGTSCALLQARKYQMSDFDCDRSRLHGVCKSGACSRGTLREGQHFCRAAAQGAWQRGLSARASIDEEAHCRVLKTRGRRLWVSHLRPVSSVPLREIQMSVER